MKVIGLMNQKGGVGKTTICINLAAVLLNRGYTVQIIDTDAVQGSATEWGALNEGRYCDVITVAPSALAGYLERNNERFDFILIDCPPRANKEAASLIKACDVILIPSQPSPFDIWASTDLIEMVTQRISLLENTTRELKAALIMSRGAPNTRLAEEAREAFADTGLPTLKGGTTQYEVYKRAPLSGSTIFDAEDKNPKACLQMEFLTTEILEVLCGHTKETNA